MIRRRNHSQITSLCIAVVIKKETDITSLLTALENQAADTRIRVFTFSHTLLQPHEEEILTRFNGLSFTVSKEKDLMKQAWEVLAQHHAHLYLWLPGHATLHPEFLQVALASWESIGDIHKQVLTLVGDRPRPTNLGTQAETCFKVRGRGPFLGCLKAIQKLDKDILGDTGLYRTQRSLLSFPAETKKPLEIVEPAPKVPLKGETETPRPARKITKKLASILVPTHHRPDILKLTLPHLLTLEVPSGWSMEILVGGTETDQGRKVAESAAGISYIEVPDDRVTIKLNMMLDMARGELIVLADDDDIQPPNRLKAAIKAHEEGADWAGSGGIWFYHTNTDRLTFWSGPSHLGLIGTSLSFRTELLRQVGGWPVYSKGKDAPLANKLQSVGAKYQDLTTDLGHNLIALQHGANLWDRPALDKGQTSQKGNFTIQGFGSLAENPTRFHPQVQATLRALQQPDTRKRIGVATERIYAVTGNRPWVPFLAEGMKAIGVPVVSLGQARNLVTDGHRILAHWYHEEYRILGQGNPAQISCVWPRSWAETALLGEVPLLEEALQAHREGLIKLYWLNDLDIPPPGITHLPPVWSPEDLITQKPVEKAHRRVVVGVHANQEGVRNHLAALAGCVGLRADIQFAGDLLKGSLAPAIKILLKGEQAVANPAFSDKSLQELLASAELFVYPPLAGGWSHWLLKSVYLGTPVVISLNVPWARHLPQWAQKLCVVNTAESSQEIREKVSHLLDTPADRNKVLQAQVKTLNALAKKNQENVKVTLNVPEGMLPVVGGEEGRRKAVFLVPTHHRPHLLRMCLAQLQDQMGIPPGWSVDILVIGQPDDPGRQVVRQMQINYVEVARPEVTAKLNAALSVTRAELVMLADDDDLQPLNRAQASIEAYLQGAVWGGSGACRFVDMATGKVARWQGKAHLGLVGTSMFYAAKLLHAVSGWPVVRRNKDGAIAHRIQNLPESLKYADLTSALASGTICLQHGQNLWGRPFPNQGERSKKGGFLITGEGTVGTVDLPRNALQALTPHFDGLARVERGSDTPRVVLAGIVLNEAEFIPQWIEQHMNWPGLEAFVVVEGATKTYGAQNPDAVNDKGLSTDDTSRLLREAESRYPGKFIYVPHGWADGPQAQQKRELRDAYCKVADQIDPDLLIILDGDEFYTLRDQDRILTLTQEQSHFVSWRLAQRHVWRPPSIHKHPLYEYEVIGGYWDVPHCRVWAWKKGSRYLLDHNILSHLERPFNPSKMFKAARWDGTPECIHLGFARTPQHRQRTNAYYVARGEGQEKKGIKRGWYVDCRSSWGTWQPGGTLPHGAAVLPYQGPIPEVFAKSGKVQGAKK